jgi:hypothetical protein
MALSGAGEVAVMGRRIVMCSDGTGNTFDARITNVGRMVCFLDASDASRQLIRYDPGVGTVAARTENVRAEGTADGDAVGILPAADRSQRGPVTWLDRMRGLALGYLFTGLECPKTIHRGRFGTLLLRVTG